eukprot:Tamp_17581.p1 GENE.Tamp_17581~~Tamp_17581.p1  ORF type:complete len:374 (+),score=62.78 Tamp_17581:258-1379(+)
MRDRNIDPIFVDERDASGWTPLMIAATHGHVAMCRLLVEREADINAKKNFQCTALHLAARSGHKGVLAFLLQCNADVLATKLDKSTALHDAVSGGHIECAKVLLEHMEDHMERKEALAVTDDRQRTLLHVASKRGHPDVVRWLLALGASVKPKDEDGKTAQDLAPDRRTLVAFPGHVDPVDVSVQKTGVFEMTLDEMATIQLDEKGKIVRPPPSPPKRGNSRKSVEGRPMTGEVGKFTSTLGILHDGHSPLATAHELSQYAHTRLLYAYSPAPLAFCMMVTPPPLFLAPFFLFLPFLPHSLALFKLAFSSLRFLCHGLSEVPSPPSVHKLSTAPPPPRPPHQQTLERTIFRERFRRNRRGGGGGGGGGKFIQS